MAVTFAEVRKAVAGFSAALTGVAGEAVAIGFIHGNVGRWVQFAVASVTAVSVLISVYAVPKGATITQRVNALEQASIVPLDIVTAAAQDAPLPDAWKQDASKAEAFIDEHAGVAATAPWPTQGVSA